MLLLRGSGVVEWKGGHLGARKAKSGRGELGSWDRWRYVNTAGLPKGKRTISSWEFASPTWFKEEFMAKDNAIICPSCGVKNWASSRAARCASCGGPLGGLVEEPATEEGHYQQRGFNFLWFLISVVVMAVLTLAILVGLPRLVPVFDFEGSAGMLLSIPIWFFGGLLVGLISPGRTFAEPATAVLFVAAPTAFLLHQGQTVKTMPTFLYVLFSALGILFALVGAYAGERIQLGEPPAA